MGTFSWSLESTYDTSTCSKCTSKTNSSLCTSSHSGKTFAADRTNPGTQTVARPPPPPPPNSSPVIPLVNLADSSITTAVTQNQTLLRAWIKSNLDRGFMLQETMINYLARMFDLSNYTVNDLLDIRMAKYDPKDHEQEPGERLPLFIILLRDSHSGF